MNTNHPALALVSLGVVALFVAGCGSRPDAAAADAPPPDSTSALVLPPAQRERIDAKPVASQSFHPVVTTTGTVAFDGNQSTQVLAPISGPVARILVQPGDHVTQGQALAYVSSPDFASAIADYRKADAQASNAKRVADLDQQLFKNDAIARRDMEQAQTDAVTAAADRDAAAQQLRALGVSDSTLHALQAGQPVATAYGVIRAPIEGTLVERLITPGELLQAGTTPCFTVADISKMWVMANVFGSDLGKVQLGDIATVTTSATPQPFRGRVDNIAALVDPTTKATQVRVLVTNTGRLLKKDMYVTVAIQSRHTENGLLIPVSAVLRDDDNRPFVFVQDAKGGYERRTVALGPRVDERYEITAGLHAGDRVVSEGGLFLQFAQSQ
ncbi:MAG TPA: efflux RND transporter periplasmic adaptor subunit [Gemmatimonadaceae bacterium]|nr:efflux RND transporter periplasmic adaptor subunit [Gemmatimonadaceae bacterium]